MRLIIGGASLVLCIGCKSTRVFISRINRFQERVALCEECWWAIEMALDSVDWRSHG